MPIHCSNGFRLHNLLSSWDDGTKSNDSKVWWIWIDRGLQHEDDIKKISNSLSIAVITKVMNVNLERCQKQ